MGQDGLFQGWLDDARFYDTDDVEDTDAAAPTSTDLIELFALQDAPNCFQQTSCGGCTAQPQCGWCQSSRTCYRANQHKLSLRCDAGWMYETAVCTNVYVRSEIAMRPVLNISDGLPTGRMLFRGVVGIEASGG